MKHYTKPEVGRVLSLLSDEAKQRLLAYQAMGHPHPHFIVEADNATDMEICQTFVKLRLLDAGHSNTIASSSRMFEFTQLGWLVTGELYKELYP